MERIKAIFDERFKRWQISLPAEDLRLRRRGSIQACGWTVRYRFDPDNGDYMEYFASHRMTNDTLVRIYSNGKQELVGFCQEFYPADDPEGEQSCLEHNRQFYMLVEACGLA